jgi:hypothetical protein
VAELRSLVQVLHSQADLALNSQAGQVPHNWVAEAE